jgi:hypothetical protein
MACRVVISLFFFGFTFFGVFLTTNQHHGKIPSLSVSVMDEQVIKIHSKLISVQIGQRGCRFTQKTKFVICL